VAKRRIPITDGLAAVDQLRTEAGGSAAAVTREGANSFANPTLTTAVRFLLEDLAVRIPGNSVEVRVPLFGAVQCVPGPDHRRGTPPNVVEMDAQTWLALALGEETVEQALAAGKLRASGTRALEFASVLPLVRPS
jgi:Bacterial SCP ortholog